MLQERKVRLQLRGSAPRMINTADEYLDSLLSGGPMLKTNIYRQSQADGHTWSDVIDAKDRLNLNCYSIRGFEYWKLSEY